MNRFGEVAVKAAQLCQNQPAISPQDAWEKFAAELIESDSTSEKGCPRDAFLGLCQEGFVRGIRRGKYTRSKKNKRYAVMAVRLLKVSPELSREVDRLWEQVLNGEHKSHNSQMNVVVDLWNNGLIR